MCKTIAIIENQQTQFQALSDYLLVAEGYSVIPLTTEYSSFIDAVKIYLNPRYLKKAQEEAFKEIVKNIKSADILLIDHRLCGNSKGRDGIDLAEAILLYKRKAKVPLPLIIFFSRSPKGAEVVKTRLQQFEGVLKDYNENTHWKWIEKGYTDVYGDEEKYFKKWVIENGIRKMLLQNEPEQSGDKEKRDNLVMEIMDCFSKISERISENIPENDRRILSGIIQDIQDRIDNVDFNQLETLLGYSKNNPIYKGAGNTTDLRNLIQKLKQWDA